MTETVALALAYLLDLIIGDPRWLPHPVRWTGRAVEKIENAMRRSFSCFKPGREAGKGEDAEEEMHREKYRINITDMVPSFLRRGKKLSVAVQEKIAGVLLVASISVVTYVSFYILTNVLLTMDVAPAADYAAFALYVYLVSTTLATSGLLRSATLVIRELNKGDVESSRDKLSRIVGRDTDSLKETGVLKATIESLSENASDGIIAPLFYFVIGGLPLAMTYKAINTMDSMIGYKNKKYRNFGWAAARLDDVVNYIPARITGLLIVAVLYLINSVRYIVSAGSDRLNKMRGRAGRYLLKIVNLIAKRMEKPDFDRARNAMKIMIRDGKKHSSPNSGVPEAAMAGALGIRLGGPSNYGGVKVKKPYIGDAVNMKKVKNGIADLYMKAALSAIAIIRLISFLGFIMALVIV